MQKIIKYAIGTVEYLDIPGFVAFLDLQIQHGRATLWVLTDPAYPPQQVTINSFLTGQLCDIDPKSQHLGTLQFDNGNFVEHYYAIYH